MANQIYKVRGTQYEWDGKKLKNLETDIDYELLSFERNPFYEKINPEYPKYRGRGIVVTSYVSVAAPKSIENVAGWFVTKVMSAFMTIAAKWKKQDLQWISVKAFKSTERIDVPYWFDRVAYRVEWTLRPPVENLDGGFGEPITIAAGVSIALIVLAALVGLGFVVGVLKMTSKDIGKVFSRTTLAVLAISGIYLYTKFSSS